MTEECITHYEPIGEIVYQNICTYEEVRVPWTVWEWFSFGVVIIAIVCIFYTLFGGE